jgi:dUTP pyrophosphatase
MHLFVYIEDPSLKLEYMEHVKNHNEKIKNSKYPDAGFDLLTPESMIITSNITKVNYKIRCSAKINENYVSYYLYPRSSLGLKTCLRLANSAGIIDSGYRNDLMSVFDSDLSVNFAATEPKNEIKQYSRLVQICAPDLRPIIVSLVDYEKNLSSETERNYGGFGSTGL